LTAVRTLFSTKQLFASSSSKSPLEPARWVHGAPFCAGSAPHGVYHPAPPLAWHGRQQNGENHGKSRQIATLLEDSQCSAPKAAGEDPQSTRDRRRGPRRPLFRSPPYPAVMPSLIPVKIHSSRPLDSLSLQKHPSQHDACVC